MKMLVAVYAVAGCLAFVVFSDAANASTRAIRFTNGTSQDVDDLHLEFTNKTKITGKGGFANNRSASATVSKIHNLWGNLTVAANGKVTIDTESTYTNILLRKWWWTSGGNATGNGTRVGSDHSGKNNKDDGGYDLAFSGGLATGDGSILVSINGSDHYFQTIAGATPENSAIAFGGYLDGIVDGAFALMHYGFTTSTSVGYTGNLLGDPTTVLSTSIVTSDSTQGFQMVEIPEPATLLLLGFGSVMLRRKRS